MGPHPHPNSNGEKQTARRRRPFVRRPRTRCCLLKGCDRCFRPAHALGRYCSPACREQARQWAKWKAQQTYRKTAMGKEKRNQQSRCYRGRRKGRSTCGEEQVSDPARVIPKKIFSASCDRPGCYECFERLARSPRQRFCSRLCRRALERVWERERRWRRWHRVSPAQLHQAGDWRGR